MNKDQQEPNNQLLIQDLMNTEERDAEVKGGLGDGSVRVVNSTIAGNTW